MSTRINIDAARAIAIINSRTPLSRTHVGQQVLLTVQGAGTFQSATQQEAKTPGQKAYFDKYIHNLKANSTEAMSRPENKAIFAAAMKAEAAGNVDEASELFNEYLNNVQVSFNAIARPGVRKFEDGDMCTALVEEADTKSGNRAIVVNQVKYKAPTTVEKVKFSITDLLGEEAPVAVDNAAVVTE
jgi:hypothetical protein